MGFWTDCINPYRKINHGFWSHGQPCSFAKICDGCWYQAGHREPTITPGYNKKPKAFKQCGSDTL